MNGRRLPPAATARALALALLALVTLAASDAAPTVSPSRRCPEVRVSCPGRRPEGRPVTFTAALTPGHPGATYVWRTDADILSGQNTQNLRVDSRGLAGQRLKATVTVDDRGPGCDRVSKSCTTRITPPADLPNSPPSGTLSASTSTVVLAAECGDEQRPDPDCRPTRAVVRLLANMTDPDGDTLLYTYSTTGGRVTGDGPEATLDLTGVAPGAYTVTVQVDDGSGLVPAFTTVVSVERCGCVPRRPRP